MQYHAWHALGLLAFAVSPDSARTRSGSWLLLAGIILFSGSLYALALGAPRSFGVVTPFGGLAFIAGWLALAVGVISARTPA